MNALLVYRWPRPPWESALIDLGLALEAEQKVREAVARSCPDCTRLWSSLAGHYWTKVLREFRSLSEPEFETRRP